jgi:hypothetical protein
MPHYFLQQGLLENQWTLVRETPSSQEFTAEVGDGLRVLVDIHYTMPRIALATIVFIGEFERFTEGLTRIIVQDVTHILLRHNRTYDVLDTNLIFSDRIRTGNFLITRQEQEVYAPIGDFTSRQE